MGAARIKVFAVIFLLCSMCAVGWTPSADADIITNVSAASSWSPNVYYNQIGLTAVETFAASFDWDVTTQSVVANSIGYSTTGSFGPFTPTLPFGVFFADWFDASGNLIQIYSDFYGEPGAPSFDVPGTYVDDAGGFTIYLTGAPSLPFTSLQEAITSSIIVTPTPEPSSCVLTLIGLGLLGLVMRRRMGLCRQQATSTHRCRHPAHG